MTDADLRHLLAEMYEAIRDLRTAYFQSRLSLQALRAMIGEVPDLERRYAAHLQELENAPDAHLFDAWLQRIDETILRLRQG